MGYGEGSSHGWVVSLPIVLRPEAEADLTAVKAWYDSQKAGLGDQFVAAVTTVFERIALFPDLYAPFWREVRLVRVKKFPYVVYYRHSPDEVIILAVLHGSRDQGILEDRV